MKAKDQFKVSDGNLKVLELIPYMMKDKEYRQKLRALAIDFNYMKHRK